MDHVGGGVVESGQLTGLDNMLLLERRNKDAGLNDQQQHTFQVSNWMTVGTRTVSITTQKQSSVICG